jgi:8-oxo-dGTP pyrophosphatase MutT (NUDIX family)
MAEHVTPGVSTWRKLASRAGQALPLFGVRLDTLEHPRSGQRFERLVLESVDWVNVVALDTGGRLVMVEQYRFGIEDITLETPGGMVDDGEQHAAAARRELLEETGYGDGEWSYLGAVQPNPAIHDHLCHHWLARDVQCIAALAPGAGEDVAVHLLEPDALAAAIDSGRLRHALALSALSRVFPLFRPRPGVPALTTRAQGLLANDPAHR